MRSVARSLLLWMCCAFPVAAAGAQTLLEQALALRERGDYESAAEMLGPLADAGDPQAQLALGQLYYLGRGVPRDFAETARRYRSAAEQGLAEARYGMGVLFATGRGVEPDYGEAARWFALAAAAGHAPAQFDLGLLVEAGRGVPQDRDRALLLFSSAAAAGLEEAAEHLATLGVDDADAGGSDGAAAAGGEAAPSIGAGGGDARAPGTGRQRRTPVVPAELGPAPRAPRAPSAPTAPAAAVPPVASAAPIAPQAPRARAFRRQPAKAYTLQVASVALRASAEALAESLDGLLDLDVFVVAYAAGDGSPRHAVLVGVFASRDEARGSLDLLLPLDLGGDPWPRRIGDLQALMRDR